MYLSTIILTVAGGTIGYLLGRNAAKPKKHRPSDSRMDMIYTTPPDAFIADAAKLGITVKDATDAIHEHRVMVFYSRKGREAYFNLLKAHRLEEKSMSYASREYTKE